MISHKGGLIMDKILDVVSTTSLCHAAIYLGVGIVATPLIQRIIRKTIEIKYKRPGKENDNQGETVIKLLQSVSKYVIWIIVIIGILSSFGVNTNALLASAGLVGIAVGFGAQSLIKDVIAGLFFIIEDQMNVGDLVEINGFKGIVQEIGLKTIKLKNWLGEIKFISNGSVTEIINSSLENPTIYIDIPVSHDENIEEVISLLNDYTPKLKKEMKELVGEIVVLGIEEFSATTITIRLTTKTKKGEQFSAKRKIARLIREKFKKEKIKTTFPFPLLKSGKNDK